MFTATVNAALQTAKHSAIFTPWCIRRRTLRDMRVHTHTHGVCIRALACLVSTYTRYLRTFRTIFFRWSFFESSNHRVQHYSFAWSKKKKTEKNHRPETGEYHTWKSSHVKLPSRTTTFESVLRWNHRIGRLPKVRYFPNNKITKNSFTYIYQRNYRESYVNFYE